MACGHRPSRSGPRWSLFPVFTVERLARGLGGFLQGFAVGVSHFLPFSGLSENIEYFSASSMNGFLEDTGYWHRRQSANQGVGIGGQVFIFLYLKESSHKGVHDRG